MKKFLSHEQFYQVAEWLKGQQVEKLNGNTNQQVTQLASIDLGLKVSEYSMSNVRKTTGVNWYVPNSKNNASGNLDKRLGALEQKVDNLMRELGLT